MSNTSKPKITGFLLTLHSFFSKHIPELRNAAAMAGVGLILSVLYLIFLWQPQYRASCHIQFFSDTSTFDEATFYNDFSSVSRSYAQSYHYYFKLPLLTDIAAADLATRPDLTLSRRYSSDDFQRIISASLSTSGNIIDFSVTTYSPDDSNTLCTYYADLASHYIVSICNAGTYEIVAGTPATADNPVLLNTVLYLLGFVFLLGAIGWLFTSRNLNGVLPVRDRSFLKELNRSYVLIGETPIIQQDFPADTSPQKGAEYPDDDI